MILKELLELVSGEKRKKERVKVARSFVVGMGVVATVGVAAGILFAPKSGKQTRTELKKKAVNAVGSIKDTVQKGAETLQDTVAHTAQEVSSVIKEVHKA